MKIVKLDGSKFLGDCGHGDALLKDVCWLVCKTNSSCLCCCVVCRRRSSWNWSKISARS